MKLPNIDLFKQDNNEDETTFTLRNTQNNNYYRLQEEGLYLWNLMDGKYSLRDIINR